MKAVFIATLCAMTATTSVYALPLTLENGGTRVVEGVSVYPEAPDGTPVEDNLGGFFDPLAPGEKRVFEIDGGCGRMLAVVNTAGEELRLSFDSCKHQSLKVSD